MSFLKANSSFNTLLYIGFNQNYRCFACGTSSGFLIFNSDHGEILFRREFNAGIGFICMLFRTNIIALVGGGINPYFPPNKLIIWDDHQGKAIGEISFKTNVLCVKMRRDKIIILVKDKIYIYNLHNLKLIDHATINNTNLTHCALCYERPKISSVPRQLVASYDPTMIWLLAIPALEKNQKNKIELRVYSQTEIKTIQIPVSKHEKLSQSMGLFEMSFSGDFLATSAMFDEFSTICIYDLFSSEMLQEFYHNEYNINNSKITSLCFSPRKSYLAYSFAVSMPSDDFEYICSHWSGTAALVDITNLIRDFYGTTSAIFIQKLKDETNDMFGLNDLRKTEKDMLHSLQMLRSLATSMSYGQNAVSDVLQHDMVMSKSMETKNNSAFAWFHVRDNCCIVSFSQLEEFIIVISGDGNYYNASLNISDGGECILSNHVCL
eukprot:174466_1